MNEKQSKFCVAILWQLCRSKLTPTCRNFIWLENNQSFSWQFSDKCVVAKFTPPYISSTWMKNNQNFATQFCDICVVANFTPSYVNFTWTKNNQNVASQFCVRCVVAKFTPSSRNCSRMKNNQVFFPAIMRRMCRSKIYTLIPQLHMIEIQSNILRRNSSKNAS